MTQYAAADVVVIGLGIYGASTVRSLSRAGVDVIGLDALEPPHLAGSSHGESRLFRFTTIENKRYNQLAHEAFTEWQALQLSTTTALYKTTGYALIEGKGSSRQRHHGQSEIVAHAERLATRLKIPHTILRGSEFAVLFPRLRIEDTDRIFLEHGALILNAEACLDALLRDAHELGARLLFPLRAVSIRSDQDYVMIRCADDTVIKAKKVIVCAGPWVQRLIPTHLDVRVLPQAVAWFRDDTQDTPLMPFVMMRARTPLLFAFPEWSTGTGIKAVIENEVQSISHPNDAARHLVVHEEHKRLVATVQDSIAGVSSRPTRRQTCYYTSTPDGSLQVLQDRSDKRITIVSCCSGHGFKFAPAVGERIARRVLANSTLDNLLFTP